MFQYSLCTNRRMSPNIRFKYIHMSSYQDMKCHPNFSRYRPKNHNYIFMHAMKLRTENIQCMFQYSLRTNRWMSPNIRFKYIHMSSYQDMKCHPNFSRYRPKNVALPNRLISLLRKELLLSICHYCKKTKLYFNVIN